MLETDLDIALSQGKTIDAREFAEQLILRELCTIQSGLPARCPRRPPAGRYPHPCVPQISIL